MASRITIYDKTGLCIAEVNALAKRSWILSKFGVANFQISTQDPKCRREILEFGNYVLIEHEKVPAWVGVIVTPRKWKFGSVTVTANSAEWIFRTRRGEDGKTWYSYCGNNFKELIAFANIASDTRITAGEIYVHGYPYKMDLTYGSDLYTAITQMSDYYYKHEWDVTPAWDAQHRLVFKANWYLKRSYPRQTALEEGNNIEMVDDAMTEQGDIINDYRFTGSGVNHTDKSTFTATDPDSIARYGLIQKAETGPAEELVGNVEANARAKLDKIKNPKMTFNFKVLDIGTVWNEMQIGAQFPVKMHSCGFFGSQFGAETVVRITGMVFDDAGRLEITCEEDI